MVQMMKTRAKMSFLPPGEGGRMTSLCVMVGRFRTIRTMWCAVIILVFVAAVATWNPSQFDHSYSLLYAMSSEKESTTAVATTATSAGSFPPSSKEKRVSPKELLEAMSPPGIEPKNVTRVKGMMVKCDVEKWSGYLRREHYYIYDGLIQTYGWEEVNLDRVRTMANNAQEEDDELPQVLFLCEPAILYLDHLLPWLQKLKKKGVHIAYHTDDLTSAMNKVDSDQLASAFSLFDTYMGTYAYRIKQYLRQVPISEEAMPKNIIWIPHSVSPEFLQKSLQINPSARRRVLLPGKVNKQYPLRIWAQNSIKRLPMLDILPHRGYSFDHGQNQQVDFANQIASYSAAFTCGLFHHYIVAKMFEIPAVGTLMLVNNNVSDLLRALRLIDGIHYKSYDSMDPEPTLKWAVDPANQDAVDKMRQAGMELVREHHQVGHRVHAIASYFASGKVTYPIPETYKNDPCPVVSKPDVDSCMREFLLKGTKPLLALV
jgi:hypothetical protein